MNRIMFSREGEIRPAAVVLVGLILSAMAFGTNTLIANAVPPALGAPGEVSQFGTMKVALATFPAVLGNALGFYMSYRRYDPRAGARQVPRARRRLLRGVHGFAGVESDLRRHHHRFRRRRHPQRSRRRRRSARSARHVARGRPGRPSGTPGRAGQVDTAT